jgi:recombinational DNA repair protein RecR
VILVCDQDQAKELVEGLTSVDPHYRVLGFVNSDSASSNSEKLKIKSISIENLAKFVRQNSISEIVVASQKTDGITVNLQSIDYAFGKRLYYPRIYASL